MKKLLVVAVIVMIGAGVAGWYLFESQPAAKPTQVAAPNKQEAKLNPNEHGFFDVDFAQKMIVHHQQAIEMTDIILASSSNQAIRNMQTDIRNSQSDAEAQYKKWLGEWGETYTNLADFPQTDGHDLYPSYPGLVSSANMMLLRSASGSEAEKPFISLMTEHHKGGIETGEMSRKLQYGKMIEFKDKVFTGYKDDLERMKEL